VIARRPFVRLCTERRVTETLSAWFGVGEAHVMAH
jgi:hypothetical protein